MPFGPLARCFLGVAARCFGVGRSSVSGGCCQMFLVVLAGFLFSLRSRCYFDQEDSIGPGRFRPTDEESFRCLFVRRFCCLRQLRLSRANRDAKLLGFDSALAGVVESG